MHFELKDSNGNTKKEGTKKRAQIHDSMEKDEITEVTVHYDN